MNVRLLPTSQQLGAPLTGRRSARLVMVRWSWAQAAVDDDDSGTVVGPETAVPATDMLQRRAA